MGWENSLEEGLSRGGGHRRWGPEGRCHSHHCLALVSLGLSLTPSPLEAVSQRLAVLENRVV